MSWLDPVSAALDAAPATIFFRDDDAGWADGRLRDLLDLFDRRGVRVDVAVIPAELGPELATELTARARSGGIRLHQHGWAHANHEPTGRKHEFGPSRTAAEQAADVARGRRVLRDAFGNLVDPVFTPPWNRCVPATAELLTAAGFTVLSRDSSAAPVPGIAEVPVTVDWFGHRKGVRWTRDELGRRIAAAVAAGAPVGVMLHHAITDVEERAAVDELLALVAGSSAVRATTIAELGRAGTARVTADGA